MKFCSLFSVCFVRFRYGSVYAMPRRSYGVVLSFTKVHTMKSPFFEFLTLEEGLDKSGVLLHGVQTSLPYYLYCR
jgi:hypothetical protein